MRNVLLVDDHTIMVVAVQTIVEGEFPEEEDIQVLHAQNGRDMIARFDLNEIDLVLLDIQMEEMDGMQTARYIKENHPKTKVIVLSGERKGRVIREIVETGVNGYVLKNNAAKELGTAIKQMLQESPEPKETFFCKGTTDILLTYHLEKKDALIEDLNDREIDILQLLYDGKSIAEIADTLHLSIHTIRGYRGRINQKFELDNLVIILRLALKWGYIKETPI